jgi:hypothetical protein
MSDRKEVMKAMVQSIQQAVSSASFTVEGKAAMIRMLKKAPHPEACLIALTDHLEKLRALASKINAEVPHWQVTSRADKDGHRQERGQTKEERSAWFEAHRKPRERSEKSTNDSAPAAELCKGCGNKHPSLCYLVEHPDYNKTDKSWAESPNGKRWLYVAKRNSLSRTFKIDMKTL